MALHEAAGGIPQPPQPRYSMLRYSCHIQPILSTAFAFLRFILRFLDKLFMRFILRGEPRAPRQVIVAIFYPFSQFCEMNISLLSLQKQPNAAPNLFQRGVEYGKYVVLYHSMLKKKTRQLTKRRIN